MHHTCWFNPGKFLINSLKGVSQFLVIDAQLMEHGCMEISYMDRVFGNIITVTHPSLHSLSLIEPLLRHPCGEASGVMVPVVTNLFGSVKSCGN